MKRARCTVAVLLSLACLGAAAGTLQVHGELDQFSSHGVAMAWAILKAPSEDDSRVVVRLVAVDPRFVSASLDGVDPFTQRRQQLLPRSPLGRGLDAVTSRGTFADLPRREFHFFTADDERRGQPSLTVYFLGGPDTTPEFLTEAALTAHLDTTIARLVGRAS
jgi:hypothetical protein